MKTKYRLNILHPRREKEKESSEAGQWNGFKNTRYIKCFFYMDSRKKRSRKSMYSFDVTSKEDLKIVNDLKEICKSGKGYSSALIYINDERICYRKISRIILGIKL